MTTDDFAATTWGSPRRRVQSRPRGEDARSKGRRAFLMSWVTPHPLGTFKFIKGGGYTTIHRGGFEGFFARAFALRPPQKLRYRQGCDWHSSGYIVVLICKCLRLRPNHCFLRRLLFPQSLFASTSLLYIDRTTTWPVRLLCVESTYSPSPIWIVVLVHM